MSAGKFHLDPEKIFEIDSDDKFNDFAINLFRFQHENCLIYQKFVHAMDISIENIQSWREIPCLPISFFKTHPIKSFVGPEQKIFLSSTTTGQTPSKHYIKDLNLYKKSFRNCFEHYYGPVSDYIFIALLPSYMEREGSSLLYMMQELIEQSGNILSGFYKTLHLEELKAIDKKRNKHQKIFLWGVTYALLDLIKQWKPGLVFKNLIILETGGMKGRRQEISKEEIHHLIKSKTGVKQVHSEYGMTELLSQAYALKDGLFQCPAWMKVCGRDLLDPKELVYDKNAAINIIDLANIYSCSFIATDDVGKVYPNGQFEVKGRLESAELRGCNLML